MLEVVTFFAGFTTGWAVRATANSSRSLVVALIAQAHGAVDRVRTLTAIEREALEDLLAEGKAVYEASRRGSRSRASRQGREQAGAPEASKPEVSAPETKGHEAPGPSGDHAGRPAGQGRARGAGSPS